MPAKTKKNPIKPSSKYLVASIIVAVIAVFAFCLWLEFHSSSKSKSVSTQASTSPSVTPESTPNVPSTAPGVKSYSSTQTGVSPQPTVGAALAAPTGQLLNLQCVSLSSTQSACGGSAPDTPSMQSVCQTIANASCNIKLSNGSAVKYVGAQGTGSNGMVVFNWNANSVGLTPGTWTVQAIVNQGNSSGISHSEYLAVKS
jgi:hypothetical protein